MCIHACEFRACLCYIDSLRPATRERNSSPVHFFFSLIWGPRTPGLVKCPHFTQDTMKHSQWELICMSLAKVGGESCSPPRQQQPLPGSSLVPGPHGVTDKDKPRTWGSDLCLHPEPGACLLHDFPCILVTFLLL